MSEQTKDTQPKAGAQAANPGKPIDVTRCLRGMKNIYVEGAPNRSSGSSLHGSRIRLIEKAISLIQADGTKAMEREYLGFKNYAGFGDQGCDGEYGMGPRHGSIVFSVGRTHSARGNDTILGADEIYLLECVRDFGSEQLKSDRGDYDQYWNLIDIIRKAESLHHDWTFYDSYLVGARVESVLEAANG